MEKLLPHYERELSLLRSRFREFAQRFPKLGEKFGLSGERISDPGVERLVQVVALLCARITRKMECSHERFTNDLLGTLSPFYLRPIPACSVVQMDGADRQAISTVARGTELHTKAAPACGFRTAYDVTIAPIAVTVRFAPRGEVPATLKLPNGVGCEIAITIETTDPAIALEAAAGSPVRVFVDADGPARVALLDAIFMRTLCTCVESEKQWRKLAALPFAPVGYAKAEALLPTPRDQEESLRLLAEYFAFPEKFDFFDIDLKTVLAACPAGARRLDLHLLLPDMHATAAPQLLRALPPSALRLGCTPVINLFSRTADPIRLRKRTSAYPVTVQHKSIAKATMYSVDAIKLLHGGQGADTAIDMDWFYHRAYKKQHCWIFELADADFGTGDTVSFVNGVHEPLKLDEGSAAVQVTCTNGDLPCSMPLGRADGDLTTEGNIGGAIRMLRKPSAPLQLARQPNAHWDFIRIAHASQRNQAQYHLPSLLALLHMHARPDSAVAARQLSGIVGVSRRIVKEWMKFRVGSALEKGYEVTLTLDQAAFTERSIFVFAQVLERVLPYYLVFPHFVRLNVLGVDGQELIRGVLRQGCQSPA